MNNQRIDKCALLIEKIDKIAENLANINKLSADINEKLDLIMCLVGISAKKSRGFSRKQIQWLNGIADNIGIDIQHAENGGEHCVIDEIRGKKYYLDGFAMVDKVKIAFEFDGCYWHGCIKCYPDLLKINATTGKLFGILHQLTIARTSALIRLGYVVVNISECEHDDMVKNNTLADHYADIMRLYNNNLLK